MLGSTSTVTQGLTAIELVEPATGSIGFGRATWSTAADPLRATWRRATWICSDCWSASCGRGDAERATWSGATWSARF